MNILYYDDNNIKLPEIDDSDHSDEDHFISIEMDRNNKNGRMIDVYVSLDYDISHKAIIHINE